MKRELIKDNLDEVIRILFRYYGCKFDDYARNLYHNHPRYGNIDAIAYILSRYGIDSSLIQTDLEELYNLPYPLIINYDGLYLPLIGINSNNSFVILNEAGESESITLEGIDSIWDKKVLVFQKDDKGNCGERKEKIIWEFKHISTVVSCFLAVVVFIVFSAKIFILNSLIRDFFLLSSTFGLTVSALFHVQKLNRGNLLVNRICHSSADHSSKRDCSSILDSTASKFLGMISWVDIGTVYFMFFLLVLWFIRTDEATIILALISLCSSLYIPYSIYYQAKIAGRWCTLCLSVQAILFLNALVSIPYLFNDGFIIDALFTDAVLMAAIALATIFLYTVINNILTSYYLIKKSDRKNRQLLFSPEIIHQLIYETPEIDFTQSLKIPVITREGDTELIMVINPLCSPCIKETREILGILNRKRYTSLSIIFLVDPKANNEVIRAKLLITESMMENFLKALTDYANHFPKKRDAISTMSFHQDSQKILDSHFHWCINNNILATPKIFINNHELPSLYTVKDIDFLIE